jgi:hypothetical protein
MAKKPLTFWKADEVKAIAETLIADFHQHIGDLTVLYVFRSEHTEENGKVVLGKARKGPASTPISHGGISSKGATAKARRSRRSTSSRSRLIRVAALTGPQRLALVDHELSHIGADGLLSHDVEEFSGVIERHGLWRPALEEFIEASKQQPLFETTSDRSRPDAAADRNKSARTPIRMREF